MWVCVYARELIFCSLLLVCSFRLSFHRFIFFFFLSLSVCFFSCFYCFVSFKSSELNRFTIRHTHTRTHNDTDDDINERQCFSVRHWRRCWGRARCCRRMLHVFVNEWEIWKSVLLSRKKGALPDCRSYVQSGRTLAHTSSARVALKTGCWSDLVCWIELRAGFVYVRSRSLVHIVAVQSKPTTVLQVKVRVDAFRITSRRLNFGGQIVCVCFFSRRLCLTSSIFFGCMLLLLLALLLCKHSTMKFIHSVLCVSFGVYNAFVWNLVFLLKLLWDCLLYLSLSLPKLSFRIFFSILMALSLWMTAMCWLSSSL